MRVLVTGGAGRLGISVCRKLLDSGFEVRVFDLDTSRNRECISELRGKAEVCWGDVTRPGSVRQALDGVDGVVHMAAVLPPRSEVKPDLAREVNVAGTRTIVDIIREKGERIPFVFTSSVAVFGPRPDASEPLSPDKDEPRPFDVYGKTKLEAEELIKDSGIDYLILRLTAVMYFAFELSDLKRMYTISLDNRVEFCHPDDLSVAIVNAVRGFDLVKGRTLIISGGPEQRMYYRDMLGSILGVMGLPVPPPTKFTREPSYLDWYDTSKSQQLLRFQRKTFRDYLADYTGGLARRYTAAFLPFMRYFVSPVLGRAVVRFM
ncbi:MAG: NAD(P)-dependent oxidoreductase [Dehalococcoidia bacterium]|nr:NAD(P)-dependent oxidoreductase [Dehalococcoidia bacterium]